MSSKKTSKGKKSINYTRQDLMKFSSKELQKICTKNKYKLKKNATKMDMINTILSFNKKIQLKTNKKNKLTPLQKGEYLTSGYVRNVINSISKHKYDHQLSILIGQYIGHGLFMCFDVYYPKYDIDIQSGGKIIQRGVYKFSHQVKIFQRSGKYPMPRKKTVTRDDDVWILYGSSMAMKKGIHEWKIKVIRYDASKDWEGDEFGVTSKIDLCCKENHWGSSNKNIYTFHLYNKNFKVFAKEKDVIKLRLNCNKGRLSFRINNKSFNETIELKRNCEYYPVILSKNNNSKYKLITD